MHWRKTPTAYTDFPAATPHDPRGARAIAIALPVLVALLAIVAVTFLPPGCTSR
jgi:hypothetical protein